MQHANATVRLAEDQGYVNHYAVALVLGGWASAMLGNASGGIQQIRNGLEAHEATSAAMDRPYFLALLAEAIMTGGDFSEAQVAIEQALADIPDDHSFFYEAELHRLRGLALSGPDLLNTPGMRRS